MALEGRRGVLGPELGKTYLGGNAAEWVAVLEQRSERGDVGVRPVVGTDTGAEGQHGDYVINFLATDDRGVSASPLPLPSPLLPPSSAIKAAYRWRA